MPEGERQSWFNTQLDWSKLVAILTVVFAASLYVVTNWQDGKTQMIETRAAINTLAQKLDDSMGKQNDRVATIDRDWRNSLDNARQIGARERQILEGRVASLEAKQDANDKRAGQDAVALATLREQLGNLIVSLNGVRELLMNQQSHGPTPFPSIPRR